MGKRSWKTVVFWFYGPTGTGKSFAAMEYAKDAYWKMGGNKWWDGYDGQSDVIIDDYRKDLCTFNELLRLLDRYPLLVERKGGSMQFLAKRIFITSPFSPSGVWEGRIEEDLAQLMRRIEHVERFAPGGGRTRDRTTIEARTALGEIEPPIEPSSQEEEIINA